MTLTDRLQLTIVGILTLPFFLLVVALLYVMFRKKENRDAVSDRSTERTGQRGPGED